MSASAPDAALYEDFAKLTGDVFWIMTTAPDEAVQFISENVRDLLGHPAADFIAGGIPFMASLVDQRDLPEIARAMQILPDESGYLELRYNHPEGHTVFTQMWFRRRVRPDGSDVVEGVTREVTQLRRLESSLRESEDRFRSAMQHTAIGMALVSPAGKFLEVNAALCSLLNRPEHELRHTTWQTITHPGDLDADVALVDDVLGGRIDNYRLLKRFLRPDRSVVWGDMNVSCVRDDEGRVRHFVTQIVDMTAHMHIEQALRASEEQYRLLVEESSDFLMRTAGRTGVIAWVSDAVTRVLGWSPEEAIGRSALEFLHPDDHPHAHANRALIDAGERIQGRQRVLCADGSYKWMAQIGRPLYDDAGEVVGRISSFQDIDAQVRAEQALAETQAAAQADRDLLRATMNAMIDPHFLLRPVRDAEGAIVDFEHIDANDAALLHAGLTREQFIGSRLLQLVPGQSAVVRHYIDAFESGEPMIEDAMPLGDPAGVGPLRMFDMRGVRVGDVFSITVRDVTERVEAAAALADSQARYRLLAENASDVVYRIHIDGTVQWLSEGVQRILGSGAETFVGRDIDEFVHGPDQDLIDAAVDEAVATGRTSVRFRVPDGTGDLRWLEATIHPIIEGEEVSLVGGIRDVHAEMQAMAELDRRARTDQLTGLPNRDEAMTRLRLLLLADRSDPIAVAFCDLDGFKAINDTYGHATGDEWLRAASDRIRRSTRAGDMVARVGGDELLVVMPGIHHLPRAIAVCQKLRNSLIGEDALSTVSIGVTLGAPGEDVEAVIARADRAMYQAKQEGRDRVVGA